MPYWGGWASTLKIFAHYHFTPDEKSPFFRFKYFAFSWFQTFAAFWILYAFFWVIPRLLNFICRRFGTLCLFHLHRQVGTCLWRWNRQSVPKRRHIKFRSRRIPRKSIQQILCVCFLFSHEHARIILSITTYPIHYDCGRITYIYTYIYIYI